jgi:hypothetical protein
VRHRSAFILASLAAAFAAACGSDLVVGGMDTDAGPDDDPLAITNDPAPGSLDDLHRRIVVKSCAGQPGLCHAGQFEPNLSTPALMYENLVTAPGLEHDRQFRVRPGHPEDSLLIDKLRYRGDVATQMPLGADPLDEADIAAFEAWISDGALRAPGADPAPVLNQAPYQPEIAVFDAAGERLDFAGSISVDVGTTITLRHSVRDFETLDQDVGYPLFILQIADQRSVVFAPGTLQPNLAFTEYDADGPPGNGDLLNYRLDWTIPTDVPLVDPAGIMSTEPASGLSFTVIAYYVDGITGSSIATFSFSPDLIRVP